MKSVWLVDKGGYESYPDGVFSTKENAELVATALGYDSDSVREWELDPGVVGLKKEHWKFSVVMLRDGTVERVDRYDSLVSLDCKCFVWDRPNAPAYKGKNIPAALKVDVWAKNKKHAVKEADKKRLEMISEGKWKK